MARLRIGGHSLQLDLNPSRLSRQFAGLERIRQQMLHDTDGNTALVDQYLVRRLVGTIEHFGSRYADEMSQRLDNVFDMRDRLSTVYQSVFNGERVTPDQVRALFDQLRDEIADLHSPTEKVNGLTTLELGPRPVQSANPTPSHTPDVIDTSSTPHDVSRTSPVTVVDTNRPLTLLEHSLGDGHLSQPQRQRVRAQLDGINSNLRRLLGESTDAARTAAIRLFAQQFQGWSSWNIDGIRGVLKVFDPVRAIPHSAIYRMFQNWSSTALNQMFIQYNRIADLPGANHIFSNLFTPLQSSLLIDVYISISRLQLPDNMSRTAVLGMFNLYRQGKDVHAELLAIPPDRRLRFLEDASPLSQSLRHVAASLSHLPAQLQVAMTSMSQPIRNGISLLDGSADSIVRAIETHVKSLQHGSFSDAAVRLEFTRLIERFKRQYDSIVEHGDTNNAKLRNLVGLREEINRSIMAMEMGGSLLTVGNINRISIDPALASLPRGITVTGAPRTIAIQFDHLVSTLHGVLRAVETTTGELGLPNAWNILDPNSTRSGTTINWSSLSDLASHRKWKQIIKLWQAAQFAHQLGEAWGGVPLDMTELVIRAERFTGPARRALLALGFRIETTGGPATPASSSTVTGNAP